MQNLSEHKTGAATKRARPRPKNKHLDLSASGFFGVVAKFRRDRVVVHASRQAYLVQYRGDDGKWITTRSVGSRSMLLTALLYEVELSAACEALPEYPTDAMQAVRVGTLPLTSAQVSSAARRARAWVRRHTRSL